MNSAKFEHLQYAHDVVDGKIPACKPLIQQCERTLREHEQGSIVIEQFGIKDEYIFSEKAAFARIRFIEKLCHVKGVLTGQPIELLPFHKFFIAEVFGWVHKDNPRLKRFREAILFKARKNAKTLISAGLALFESLFGDKGSETYIAATRQEQSKILFTMCSDMIARMHPNMQARFQVYTNKILTENGIIVPVAGNYKKQDGYSPSLAIIDEAAAVPSGQFEVMESGFGARVAPLLLMITTAQPGRNSEFYRRYSAAKRGLENGKIEPTVFALIYEMDSKEEVEDATKWEKANPILSSMPSMHRQLADALIKSEGKLQKRAGVLCKNFNIFSQYHSQWLDLDVWNKCKGDVPAEGKATIGLDLSQTRDLTGACIRFDYGGNRIGVHFQAWLPRYALENNFPDEDIEILLKAEKKKELTVLEEKFIDEERIIDWLETQCEIYDVSAIGYDPWSAKRIATRLENAGYPMVAVRQGPAHLIDPIRRLEEFIVSGNILHTGSQFIQWQIQNTQVVERANGNILLQKAEDSKKIDNIAAMLNAQAVSPIDNQDHFILTHIDFA